MEAKLIINGMHCEACKTLIKMELEDNGFNKNIIKIDVNEKDNKGELLLNYDNQEDIDKIKKIINDLDQYSVIE